jgi:hypothetical protein
MLADIKRIVTFDKQKRKKNDMKAITFTDSVTDCDCCGKSDLKGTYLVIDDSNEYYYGSTCVKRNLKISASELTIQLNKSLKERKENAYNEFINSELNINYNEALKFDYEFGDEYYYQVIKPISNLVNKLKKDICIKYNLKFLI